MNGEELKTIFLEDPNDLRLNDPDVARELLSYQFCEEDSGDDEVVVAYVLNVLTQNQKLSIKESTEVIQKQIDVSALHKINEPLIQYRLGSTTLKVIQDAIGYETNEEIIETPVAYRKKVKRTIFQITKKVGITAAAAAMFTILFLPTSGNEQNAHDKSIVSYVSDILNGQVEYRNHNSQEKQITYLSWMEDGFIYSNNPSLIYENGIIRITHEYLGGEGTIIFETSIFTEDIFSNYVEVDDSMEEITIDDSTYYLSTNSGVNQFIWNTNSYSYSLTGKNVAVEVLESIIKYNFGGSY